MKKYFSILLALALALSMTACGGNENQETTAAPETEAAAPETEAATPETEAEVTNPIEMKEIMGATIPEFTIDVAGTAVTSDQMAEYAVYEAKVSTVNSSGTEGTFTYVGFSLSDVFEAAGITEYETVVATADDGYSVEVDAEVASQDSTLVAISKDGEQFQSSPWFAPCSSGTTGDYLKGMVAITLNGETFDPSASEAGGKESAEPSGELPEISDKTDKVEFAPYSFKVNGEEVTNETLEGLRIYKISVSVVNSKGSASEAGYTGYKLADVLAACGIENPTKVVAVANDGYESELSAGNIMSDHTLVAIEKDKETGEDGTVWVAPCAETSSSSYAKLVVDIKAE